MNTVYLAGAAKTYRDLGSSQTYYFLRDQLSALNPITPITTATSYWSSQGVTGGTKNAVNVTHNTLSYDVPVLSPDSGSSWDWKKIVLGILVVSAVAYALNRRSKMRRNGGCKCKRKNPRGGKRCNCRKNRGGVSPRVNRQHSEHYKKWHWGLPAKGVKEFNDKRLPEHLIEIGRFMEIHMKPFGRRKKEVVSFPENDAKNSHLAFDPEHKGQRMYMLMTPKQKARMRKYWKDTNVQPVPLASLAKKANAGLHSRLGGYPNVLVKPIGSATDVVYKTHKNGDDASLKGGRIVGPGSLYIHKLGEDGGVPPVIAVDEDGQLWYAGGSYTCPTPGITQ